MRLSETLQIDKTKSEATSTGMPSIQGIREEIDKIDKELLRLVNQRAFHALTIAELRNSANVTNFSPERELTIIKSLCDENTGPLSKSSVANVFSEIISACRSAKRPLRVAFLGPEGTFSHLAALRRFGYSALYLPQVSIDDVFGVVEKGLADVGITPVENSSEGAVSATMDQFVDSNLLICGEIFSKIRHVLMSRESSLDNISVVYSHPQALNQCRNWLKKHLPEASLMPESSTAESARISASRPGTAAIGNEVTASQHNLKILASDIQDSLSNTTRFLLLGKNKSAPSGQDRTSMVFSTAHVPGSLHTALEHFAKRSVNLTRIESRPMKNKNWEYFFFVDIEGHQESPTVKEAIESLRRDVEFLKILGSYPIGDIDSSNL
ncbi:MAG: prephenate dehydratase [Deltaproteobacteria bacterium]|nr:prephenate dehydratase [Deltaproteobacteria bacterium]